MTKNRSKCITLLILTLLFTAGLRAQSIHFKFTDDTKASYKLQDVRKITFDADVMNLHLRDGSVYAWNVSTIGHYLYNELPLNVEEWLNQANVWDVTVYPNPFIDAVVLEFSMAEKNQLINIKKHLISALFLKELMCIV